MAARLHKTSDVHRLTSLSDKVEAFLNRHALFFVCICMIILFALITVLFYTIIGVSATSTEANAWYYHLEDIV